MSELFVIQIFRQMVKQVAPMIKLLAYFFILPQYLLKSPKLRFFAGIRYPSTSKDLWPNRYHSLLELLSHTAFYLIYLLFCLNLHFAYFFYGILHCTEIELIVAYTMIHLLTSIIYNLEDIKFFIWRDPPHLVMCIVHLLCYIFIFAYYILSLFMWSELYNFLIFQFPDEYDTDKNTSYYSFMKTADLFTFLVKSTFYCVLYLVYHSAVAVHILNPLAIPRICIILTNESHYLNLSTLMSLLMFIVDIVYVVLYAFNLLFFQSFIQNHIMIYHKKFPPETAYVRDYPIYYRESNNFHLYFYKNVIIDPAHSNFFYIVDWARYLLVEILWFAVRYILNLSLSLLEVIFSFLMKAVLPKLLKVISKLYEFTRRIFKFIFSRVINPICNYLLSKSLIIWVKFVSCISWCYMSIKRNIFEPLLDWTLNFLEKYFFSPICQGFEKLSSFFVFIYMKLCEVFNFISEKISKFFAFGDKQYKRFISYVNELFCFLYTKIYASVTSLFRKCYYFIELFVIRARKILEYLYGKFTFGLIKLWDMIRYLYGQLALGLIKLWCMLKYLYEMLTLVLIKLRDILVYIYGKLTYFLIKLWGILVYIYGKLAYFSIKLWGILVYIYGKLALCMTKLKNFLGFNNEKDNGISKIFSYYLQYVMKKIYQTWVLIYPHIKYVIIDLLFRVVLLKIYHLLECAIKKVYNRKVKNQIDYHLLGLNTLYYTIQGLIYIITPITLILNHISLIHVISFYGIMKKGKNSQKALDNIMDKQKISFIDYNLFIYVQKTFDTFVLMIRFAVMTASPVHTLGAIIFSIRKGCLLKSFFPLIGEEEQNYVGSKEEVMQLAKFFFNRRSETLRNIFNDFISGMLFIVNLILLITPLYGLNYVIPFVQFFSQCSTAEEIRFEKIKSEFNNKIYIMSKHIYLLILFFLMAILSIDPYNLFHSIKLCYRLSIQKPIEELQSNNGNKDEEKKYENHMKEITNWLFSSEIYQFFCITLLFKFIIVHMTIVRGILFWLKFRKLIGKHQTIFEVFVNLLTVNFYNALIEWPLYPLLMIIFILSPTRFRQIKTVLSSTSLEEKFFLTFKMIGCLIDDIFTIILVIFGIFTLSQTVEMIALLYTSYKRYLINDEVSLIRYASYYNNDFKGEVKNIASRVLRNYLLVLLLVLNIFLILSLPDLWRRFSPFLNKKIRNSVLFFYPNRAQSRENCLFEINNSSFVCVAQFLMPHEIGRLSKICPELHTKFEIGLIWKNLYENYYAKLLEKNKKDLLLRMLHINNFGSYKRMCQEAHKALIKQITVLTEQERDEILGITNVFIEEFLNGLLKFPHVLLTPLKLISLALLYLESIFVFIHSLFERFSQYLFNITLRNPFSLALDLTNRVGTLTFYTIHLYGFIVILNFPIVVAISFWNVLIIIFTEIQKLWIFLYGIMIRPLRAFVNIIYKIFGLCRDITKSIYQAIIIPVQAVLKTFYRKLMTIISAVVINAGSIVEFTLFPHFEIFKALNKQALLGQNRIVIIIANILGLVFIIFPFALNYFVPKVMITLIIVNSYGFVNAYKFLTLQ